MKNKSPLKIAINLEKSNISSPRKSIKGRNNSIEENTGVDPFIKLSINSPIIHANSKSKIKLPKIHKRKSETNIPISEDEQFYSQNFLVKEINKKTSHNLMILSPNNLHASQSLINSEYLRNEQNQKLLIAKDGKQFNYNPKFLEFIGAKLFKIHKNKKKSLQQTPSRITNLKIEEFNPENGLNVPINPIQAISLIDKQKDNMQNNNLEPGLNKLQKDITIHNASKLKAPNKHQSMSERIVKGISKKPRIKENNIKLEDLKDELGGYNYSTDPTEKTYQLTIISSMCKVIIEKLNYLILVFVSKMWAKFLEKICKDQVMYYNIYLERAIGLIYKISNFLISQFDRNNKEIPKKDLFFKIYKNPFVFREDFQLKENLILLQEVSDYFNISFNIFNNFCENNKEDKQLLSLNNLTLTMNTLAKIRFEINNFIEKYKLFREEIKKSLSLEELEKIYSDSEEENIIKNKTRYFVVEDIGKKATKEVDKLVKKTKRRIISETLKNKVIIKSPGIKPKPFDIDQTNQSKLKTKHTLQVIMKNGLNSKSNHVIVALNHLVTKMNDEINENDQFEDLESPHHLF